MPLSSFTSKRVTAATAARIEPIIREDPGVEVVTTVYATGVRLTKAAMDAIEAQVARLPGLDKWFVDIAPAAAWDG